jgi:hypothetical protein
VNTDAFSEIFNALSTSLQQAENLGTEGIIGMHGKHLELGLGSSKSLDT